VTFVTNIQCRIFNITEVLYCKLSCASTSTALRSNNLYKVQHLQRLKRNLAGNHIISFTNLAVNPGESVASTAARMTSSFSGSKSSAADFHSGARV
jgi:hypothetical protein